MRVLLYDTLSAYLLFIITECNIVSSELDDLLQDVLAV